MINDVIELSITKTVFGGDGLSLHGGKVYFVEGALPGEKVRAKIFEEKKNFSRARILEILQKSSHRIEPLCRHAIHCGGCQYQHVEYEKELRLKEEQLAEILQAVPGFDSKKISPIVASPSPEGYRNGVTLHPIFTKKSKAATLGFIGKDNISKVRVQNCTIADTRLASVFGKEFSIKKETEKATFKLSEGGAIVSDGAETFFRVKIGPESFLANSRGFFQNNLAVSNLLTQKAAEWTSQMKPDTFFDLYAGVGVFSILCAKTAKKIIAVEESPQSVQALRMNREERKLEHLRVVEGQVEKTFAALWSQEKSASSVVLLDPPRQGVSPTLASFLAKEQGLSALIYISCDPVTLARDLKIILSLGYWQVQEVVPFDMFPRTKHLEAAVLLKPSKSI